MVLAEYLRVKGVVAVAGDSRRFFVQGVQALFEIVPGAAWMAEQPRTKLIFIGKRLDRALLVRELARAGLSAI